MASDLCERFAHRAWPRVLDALARRVNPHLPTFEQLGFRGYYWVIDQAEIATDVMFRDRASLSVLMPDLIHHASLDMSSADVMCFLGRKLHPSLKAEVVTDTKYRHDAWRVKHRLARNWIKVYDKVSVLRIETTINNPREFRILRVFKDPKGRSERRWCPMNKGVANFWRYFQVGMAANRRYLDALAAAPLKGKGVAALDALCRPHTKNGRHHARFDPLRPSDRALFRAVLAGQHTIVGFRNSDLVACLYPHPPADQAEAHRRCARVSRLIAKLRGHGLVAKVPRPTPLPRHCSRTSSPRRRNHHPRPPIPTRLPRRGITLGLVVSHDTQILALLLYRRLWELPGKPPLAIQSTRTCRRINRYRKMSQHRGLRPRSPRSRQGVVRSDRAGRDWQESRAGTRRSGTARSLGTVPARRPRSPE